MDIFANWLVASDVPVLVTLSDEAETGFHVHRGFEFVSGEPPRPPSPLHLVLFR